jgi:probable rRNA maturation factor
MIEIDNRQEKIEIDNNIYKLIEKTINSALNYENFGKPAEISVVITDNEGIREYNRVYRNIDNPTDVLSFPMLEYDDGYDFEGDVETGIEDLNPESGDVVLGDMVISIEKALEQAEEYGHSPEREIAFLTVHSTLHLLGYDHINEEDRVIMREKEEAILNSLNISRESR